MKPSDIKNIHPWNSVKQKSEYETVARNIVIILAKTGDEWRELTYEEYEKYRLTDGNYSLGEKKYFNEVVGFCSAPSNARLFSESWNI